MTSPHHDDMRSSSASESLIFSLGLACLFSAATTRLAVGQIQTEKILSPDLEMGQAFGASVAIDGRTAAIGAYLRDNAVYIYEFRDSAWQAIDRLEPKPPTGTVLTGRFGQWIALKGNWLAVGDPGSSWCSQNCAPGSVYIYQLRQGRWVQAQVLSDPLASSVSEFGSAIALSESVMVVGAPEGGTGRAHIYELRDGNWTHVKALPGAGSDALYGSSVAVDGDVIACGAPFEYSVLLSVGYVDIFEREASDWTKTATLKGKYGEAFGFALALEGNTLLVGEPGHWDASGPDYDDVHVFRRGPTGWKGVQVLHPPDPTPSLWGNRFGTGLALEGRDAIVGAQWHTIGPDGGGSAYHFRFTGESWQFAGELLTSDRIGELGIGLVPYTIGLSESRVIFGSPYRDDACPQIPMCWSGAAFAFELAPSCETYCNCDAPAACGQRELHGGCANSTGFGARLTAGGSGSVVSDDLGMECRWLPSNVPVMVIMGPRPHEVPFGDGILCVGPGDKGLFFFPTGVSGTEGQIRLGPGIVASSHANFPAAGHIQPGDTWFFQAWYRDPRGPCSGFNLSNGLKVDFTQ